MDIVHKIDINATPARLYQAITTQKGLTNWWTQAKAEPKVGAVNEFTFGEGTATLRVDKLVPAREVVWSSVDVPADWAGTKLRFEITPHGKAATLRFSHTGWKSANDFYGQCNYDWAQFLRSLKLLLETGHGEPYGSDGSIASGTVRP